VFRFVRMGSVEAVKLSRVQPCLCEFCQVTVINFF